MKCAIDVMVYIRLCERNKRFHRTIKTILINFRGNFHKGAR